MTLSQNIRLLSRFNKSPSGFLRIAFSLHALKANSACVEVGSALRGSLWPVLCEDFRSLYRVGNDPSRSAIPASKYGDRLLPTMRHAGERAPGRVVA